jgi:hypothetical protein
MMVYSERLHKSSWIMETSFILNTNRKDSKTHRKTCLFPSFIARLIGVLIDIESCD